MFLADPPSTCLSPTVYYMICQAGFERKSSCALSSFMCDTGEINWEFITKHIRYGQQDPTLDYINSVRSLGPLCESIHLHLKSLTVEQFENQFVVWLQWTNCPEVGKCWIGLDPCSKFMDEYTYINKYIHTYTFLQRMAFSPM
uniref:Uncharacterized protein n=1 Tax=Pseudonaja textilis TaxID=8673 RepID=A0A670YS78_PSETE